MGAKMPPKSDADRACFRFGGASLLPAFESIVIPLDRLSLNGDFRTTRCNMRRNSISILAALASMCLRGVSSAVAQSAPDVVWEAATPSGLANSIQGVGWSPGTSGRVAVGATDPRVRTRQARNG